MNKETIEKLITANSPIPICAVSSTGKIVGANPKIEDVFIYGNIQDAVKNNKKFDAWLHKTVPFHALSGTDGWINFAYFSLRSLNSGLFFCSSASRPSLYWISWPCFSLPESVS